MTTSPHITALAHVCLKARDLDAVLRFYRDALGLPVQFNFMRQGKLVGFYLRVNATNFIEVFQSDSVPPGHDADMPLTHFCLETPDIQALRQRLAELGHAPGPISMGCDQSWQFWITDPAGIRIEFHQYTPASTQIVGKEVEVNW